MDAKVAAVDALDRVHPAWLVFKLAWIAIQLVCVIYFGQQGVLFFYQNF